MDFGSFPNPAAKLYYNNNKTSGLRLVGGVYLEVQPIKNLSIKSALNIDGTHSTNRKYTPWYQVSSVQTDTTLTLAKKIDDPFTYVWDNTATYKFNIGSQHSFTAMLGTSMQEERFHSTTATRQGVKDYGDGSWYLGNGSDAGQTNAESVDQYRSFSLFGRLNYAYLQRYLFTATLRRDEAGIFPKDNRADFFPSVGLGWIISQEKFMENQNIFQNLKLRGSWGKMGNSRINSNVIAGVSTGGNYSYVTPGGVIIPGANITQKVPDNLLWETMNEFDVALEGAVLNNRLSFEVDYYNRKTISSIFNVRTNSALGASNEYYLDNNADIVNKGFEFTLNWKDNIGDFKYSVGGNFTTNKNEVSLLKPGTLGIYSGAVNFIQTTYTTVGNPIGAFYGRQVVGIFQNQAEIDNYKNKEGIVIQPNAQPGDFKYQDTNGDGIINDYDRVYLGSPVPTYAFGINLGGSYKNFDLTVDMYGQGGNKIYNGKRFRQLGNENYDQDFFNNRWHGEGTSNTYPSADLVTLDNKVANSWYVESGDFFKIRNIQLGYTCPQKMVSKIKING
ncbi:TonB dependent receptor [compost metagenome]